jgi:hypothetical protein
LTCTITGAATTANDTVNTVAINVGDQFSVASITNGTVPTESDGAITSFLLG